MPSRWSITFVVARPDLVRSVQVAAMVSSWLESDAEHRAPRKAFTISPLRDIQGSADVRARVGANAGAAAVAIDIGLLDDDLVPRLLAGARAAVGGGRWGSQAVSVLPGAQGEVAQLESAQDWPELAAVAPSSGRVTLEFLSPVLFRRGQSYLPFPLPGLVFGHLREQWTLWGGEAKLAQEPSMDECQLTVVDFAVECVQVPLRHRTAPASMGQITYAVGRAAPARAAVGRWLALLPYTAIGAETRIGLGQAQTVDERRSGARLSAS